MLPSGTKRYLSVVPLSFSATITGVIGGFTKRKAMMERSRPTMMARTTRPMRLSPGVPPLCFSLCHAEGLVPSGCREEQRGIRVRRRKLLRLLSFRVLKHGP